MAIRIIQDAINEPIDLSKAKEHLRVEEEDTEEDGLITAYMSSARGTLEDFTRRSLAVKSYMLTLDRFQGPLIRLPYPPAVSVESFNYIDAEGNENEVSPSSYILDNHSTPARLVLKNGHQWPSNLQQINAVQITYKAGYTNNNLPRPLYQALLMLTSHMYEERQPVIVGTSVEKLPYAIDSLAWPYRVWGVDT